MGFASPTISVIIRTYREEGTIGELVETLKELAPEEVVEVDGIQHLLTQNGLSDNLSVMLGNGVERIVTYYGSPLPPTR